MTSRLVSAAIALVVVVAAGATGFRLKDDSYIYASGRLLPNSLAAGFVGRVGGMPLLVVVSALAAAVAVALLPSARARLLFVALGGFWFLFPGADALGVLGVALLVHTRSRWLWLATAGLHLVAAVVTVPMLRRWRYPWAWAGLLALLVAVAFLFADRQTAVSPWEHLVYMSRYLVPAAWLFAYSHGLAGRRPEGAERSEPPARELVRPNAVAGPSPL